MPETNHIIICSADPQSLANQGEILRRAGFSPFGPPWPLAELWCQTWLGPASRPTVDPDGKAAQVVRDGTW